MPKKRKKSGIDWSTCPHCGDRLKKLGAGTIHGGLWRCEKDNYTAPFSNYPHEDNKWGHMDTRERDLGWIKPIPPAD